MLHDRFPGNSAERQLAAAAKLFDEIQLAAQHAEQHEEKSKDLLQGALNRLFSFGEKLRTQPTEPERSFVEDFVRLRGLPWSKTTRKNPYNALVQLAFSRSSASSRSQYASVLAFASDVRVEPSTFAEWLRTGNGIKGRYPEALVHFGSPRRQHNERQRAARLKIAIANLMEREHSAAVALPTGAEAREGFKLVLAKVDAKGQASIVDVLKTSDAAIENIMLGYARTPANGSLAGQPLARLHRAIDLIVGCTASKPGRHKRHVLILNTWDAGKPVCRVQAISEEYTFAWAGMVLADHMEGLPANIPLMMNDEDALYFSREFLSLDGWAIATDPVPHIHARHADSSIVLQPVDQKKMWRTGRVPPSHQKRIAAGPADVELATQFVGAQRAKHDRFMQKAKEKRKFAPMLTIHSEAGRLEIGVPKLRGVRAIVGTSTPARHLSDRSIATDDIQRVLSTLSRYGSGFEGGFVDDGDAVTDAGLCLQTWFDEDLFSVVLPTRSGTAVNPSCEDLDLSAALEHLNR